MILDDKLCFEVLRNNKDRIKKDIINNSKNDNSWDELNLLLRFDDKKKYVFAKSVYNTLNIIKIKSDFDLRILSKVKTNKGVLILNKNELFVFNKIENKMRVFYFNYNEVEDYLDGRLFSYFIEENKKIITDNIDESLSKVFLQCLIYLDFLPVEIKYIKPKDKIGTRKSGKIVNKTNIDFIMVTKAWNYEYKTSPNAKFLSRAHWGIRWTGKGKQIPKLTFIKESLKEYNKKSNKEKMN